MSSRGKRRSSLDASSGQRKTRRRRRPVSSDSSSPAPPPPPPEPLIKLLQSDKDVLGYFQSLKANLDLDVQRWKDRAAHYKEKCQKLQTQLSEATPKAGTKKAYSATKSRSKTKVGPKASKKTPEKERSNDGLDAMGSHSSSERLQEEEINEPSIEVGTIPIDDAIFDVSDEESSTATVVETETAESQQATRAINIERTETVHHLCEAYKCLERLGVALVANEPFDKVDDPDTNFKGTERTSQVEPENGGDPSSGAEVARTTTSPDDKEQATQFVRRTDQEVVTDLMHALRAVTRVHLNYKEAKAYQPFMTPGLIPCCYNAVDEAAEAHPAVKGLSCAFRALCIMDAYCETLSDEEWNALFKDQNEDQNEAIQIGMRNRSNLVDMIVESLRGEISCSWAVLDRSSRLITTALHYHPSALDDATETSSDAADFEFGPKSQSRLAALAERCIQAQLVSNMLHHRRNPQEAAKLVWNYLLSATPSLDTEDYPRLPPVLSLCILEALLRRDISEMQLDRSHEQPVGQMPISWFSQYIRFFRECSGNTLALRALALCVHSTAAIWKARLESQDDRIADVCKVEMACYERLLESESSWLGQKKESEDLEAYREAAMNIVLDSSILLGADEPTAHRAEDEKQSRELPQSGEPAKRGHCWDATLALQLSLAIIGDCEMIANVFRHALSGFCEPKSDGWAAANTIHLCSLAVAVSTSLRQIRIRQIRIRQIDSFRLKRGLLEDCTQSRQPLCIANKMLRLMLERETKHPHLSEWDLASSVAKCCVLLADGESLYRLIHRLVTKDQAGDYTGILMQGSENYAGTDVTLSASKNDGTRHTLFRAVATLASTGHVPVVRVINLRRRPDRMDSFGAQAQYEQILVVKAVSHFGTNADNDNEDSLNAVGPGYFWGDHAFDGQGRAAEVDARLSHLVGSGQRLDTLVGSHWRPNDLKAFDRDARDDDALVMMSPSERACALSHIASWNGVARSLSMSVLPSRSAQANLFSHPENLLRLFRVTGYAYGPSLLPENERLPPTPVCVILEDDAILVDGFVERLQSLLEELPRDFHFCSLGYSRPKTAPLVKFSSQLGIPSCIWYLTGYVLSLDGAKFLADALPVEGPVDSWIGLKMCSNWDNIFGQRIGVGVHSHPLAEALPRKDLIKIMKFRAFAALNPLCSQKVGATVSKEATAGRTWRQRDTDVTYSGL